MSRLAGLCCSLVVVGGVGCTGALEDEVCPTIGVGDLVITEIRAHQTDPTGMYVELYNASTSALELRGLHLTFRDTSGNNIDHIIVRRPLTAPAGQAIVLGRFDAAPVPAHVDYGWLPDDSDDSGNPRDLPDAGDLTVATCGVTIDRVIWSDLPDDGTYSLGLTPPDATGNDTAAAWCTNDPDPVHSGATGTPGESNPACP